MFALDEDCAVYDTEMQGEYRNDLVKRSRYYQGLCEEDKGIRLDDGAVRIFLNTRGHNDGEVSKELVDFLHYIECTDEESARRSGSKNIQKIRECVKKIKSSEEMGVRYMQTWEEKVLDREKGKAEGKAEAVLSLLEDLGEVPADLRKEILEQKDIAILNNWVKLAARAADIRSFCEQIRK